jgi:hypothetical protein
MYYKVEIFPVIIWQIGITVSYDDLNHIFSVYFDSILKTRATHSVKYEINAIVWAWTPAEHPVIKQRHIYSGDADAFC